MESYKINDTAKDKRNSSDGTSNIPSKLPDSPSSAAPPDPPPWSHLPKHLVQSAKNCSQYFGWTDILGGLRTTQFTLTADFVGGGRETRFNQFNGMVLKTHCNFIFYPTPPFDDVAVKINYYRHICGNVLQLCLVD